MKQVTTVISLSTENKVMNYNLIPKSLNCYRKLHEVTKVSMTIKQTAIKKTLSCLSQSVQNEQIPEIINSQATVHLAVTNATSNNAIVSIPTVT